MDRSFSLFENSTRRGAEQRKVFLGHASVRSKTFWASSFCTLVCRTVSTCDSLESQPRIAAAVSVDHWVCYGLRGKRTELSGPREMWPWAHAREVPLLGPVSAASLWQNSGRRGGPGPSPLITPSPPATPSPPPSPEKPRGPRRDRLQPGPGKPRRKGGSGTVRPEQHSILPNPEGRHSIARDAGGPRV